MLLGSNESQNECKIRIIDPEKTENEARNSPSAGESAIARDFKREDLKAMPKAYWIAFYREISDPNKLAAYAKLSGPAIEKGGGRFLARGTPAHVYDEGQLQRTVVIEFDSAAKAVAVHDSSAYQEALAALKGGVVRDLRIVEGV